MLFLEAEQNALAGRWRHEPATIPANECDVISSKDDLCHGQIKGAKYLELTSKQSEKPRRNILPFRRIYKGKATVFVIAASKGIEGRQNLVRCWSTPIRFFSRREFFGSSIIQQRSCLLQNSQVRCQKMATVDGTLFCRSHQYCLNQVIRQWDERLGKFMAVMDKVGSSQQDTQRSDTWVCNRGHPLENGVSRWVGADMEKTSAKLAMVQTQQQLAVQSLQIANTNPENIMQRFQ